MSAIRLGEGKATGLVFTPDGTRMIHASHGSKHLQVYDTDTWQPVLSLHGHRHNLSDLQMADDGETLMSADEAGVLRIWRTHQSSW